MKGYAIKSISCGLVSGLLALLLTESAAADLVPVSSKFDVTLYGYIKLDASYDTQRTTAGNLMFFVLPEGPDGRDDEFNMTANETRLGLRFRAPDIDNVRVSGVLETDFYGGGSQNSPNPRLRLAYVDLANGNLALRAGQDWETFIVTIPRIVNFSYLADAGALGLRRPQLRLTGVLPLGDVTHLTAKVAAARTIGQDLDGRGQDDGAAAGVPTAQGALVLECRAFTTRPVRAGLSGHFGRETVGSYMLDPDAAVPVAVPEKDYDTWSAIGSLSVPMGAMLALQGAIWTGENLHNYFGGVGQGINREQQQGIGASGGWVQLITDLSPNLNVNVAYGLDNPDADDLNSGNRSRNELVFGNVFYRLNEAVTLAAEYSYLTTSYKDGEEVSNNRVQGSVIFRF